MAEDKTEFEELLEELTESKDQYEQYKHADTGSVYRETMHKIMEYFKLLRLTTLAEYRSLANTRRAEKVSKKVAKKAAGLWPINDRLDEMPTNESVGHLPKGNVIVNKIDHELPKIEELKVEELKIRSPLKELKEERHQKKKKEKSVK